MYLWEIIEFPSKGKKQFAEEAEAQFRLLNMHRKFWGVKNDQNTYRKGNKWRRGGNSAFISTIYLSIKI